jgi:hypothetical protein
MSETVCADCPRYGFCEQCTLDRKTAAEFIHRFTVDEPIWIPVGDEFGDEASDLALSGRHGRVILDDEGAWLSVGTRDVGWDWEPEVIEVIQFQAAEPTSRRSISKKYSKKEVETLVSVAIAGIINGDWVCEKALTQMTANGSLVIYPEYLDSLA